MCIYCHTSNYRKIYENHHGSIPKVLDGRSFQIHHIDGDHDNNHYTNLMCVSEQDHYKIHFIQGDWRACQIMAARMKKSYETISDLARKGALKRVKEGTHNLLKRGKESPAYKNIIYFFENIETGEVVNMTIYDFCKKYGLHKPNVCMLISKKRKTHKKWKIKGTDTTIDNRGINNSQYNPTIHTFKNIRTNEIVKMTQWEFKTTYNLNSGHVSQLINQNSKVKSIKGWVMLS